MKTILLIGKNGFLGNRILFFLKKKKAKILFPDKKELNLLSKNSVNRFIKKNSNHKINYIINCAAYIGGQGLIENNSIKMMLENTQMTINLNNLIKKYNSSIKKIIFIGSACAYPNSNKILLEKNFWNGEMFEGVSAYGIVKKFDLIYQKEIKKKFKIDYVHYNLANLYGPKDKFDLVTSHVLGALIYKFCYAKKNKLDLVEMWGSGKPVRDFLYIDDAARIISQTFEKISGLVNLGSGKGISIRNLAFFIKDYTGYKNKIIFNKNKKDGVPYKVLSNKIISEYYNVKKLIPLRDGIKETINWFKKNYL
jgi:GDP-L-fucose synthase